MTGVRAPPKLEWAHEISDTLILRRTLGDHDLGALGACAVDAADAQAGTTAHPATSVANAPHAFPEEKSWRFGVGLGYGQRTNPLIQSEDIPVVVDLDIAWFGERWFFDNFDLGFSLVDNARFTTNVVARLNSDRAFFGKTNTRYVNFSLTAGGAQVPIVPPPSTPRRRFRSAPVELKVPIATTRWSSASRCCWMESGATPIADLS